MAKITQLTNAPITEAIIDFRIEPEKEFPLGKFSELKEKIGDQYPKQEPRNLVESKIKIEPNQRQISQSTQEKGLYGFFFKSEDEKNIAQFRVNGFTFNRLKPYTSWDMIFAETKRLWKLYIDIMYPEFVTRVAVRYINHMEFPQPVKELSQYITAPPHIPGDLPKSIKNFFTRITVVEEQTDINANITQVLEQRTDSDHLPIILDIDVYKMVRLNATAPEVLPIFQNLRKMKNDIFFSYITEDTVELYK